ncbi:hypothetical protein [Pseudoxanthomonas sp. GM95]|uniref:hypothetical protein n=1 Tax=Pseudoxanthomonas sp. GM95 TaxID=1881043 RepID=UPI0011142C58|nr:hypothetical protein [Pseudoxanthomonas sp. GM95]
MTDWSYLLFAGSIYALGFVGLFAFTLLPLRAYLAIRRNKHFWHSSNVGKFALLVVAVAAVSAISLSIFPIARVFRCLAEAYCGPNRAHGWLYLAFIGLLYVGFEAISVCTIAFARKFSCSTL